MTLTIAPFSPGEVGVGRGSWGEEAWVVFIREENSKTFCNGKLKQGTSPGSPCLFQPIFFHLMPNEHDPERVQGLGSEVTGVFCMRGPNGCRPTLNSYVPCLQCLVKA